MLINRVAGDETPEQYVLFSPTRSNGEPANLTFHRSNFTFLTAEASGLHYKDDVPNPLKTVSNAHYYGRKNYEFVLFSNSDTPAAFSRLFTDIGFDFDPAPYDSKFLDEIKWLTAAVGRHEWPGQQFTKQVAILDSLA